MEPAVLNAENAAPNQKGIQVTERALKRIRVAMVKGLGVDEIANVFKIVNTIPFARLRIEPLL